VNQPTRAKSIDKTPTSGTVDSHFAVFGVQPLGPMSLPQKRMLKQVTIFPLTTRNLRNCPLEGALRALLPSGGFQAFLRSSHPWQTPTLPNQDF